MEARLFPHEQQTRVILGKSVTRPTVHETTALGAAYFAGLAVGFWPSLEALRKQWAVDRVFSPVWDDAVREEGYLSWKRAVARAKGWIAENPQDLA